VQESVLRNPRLRELGWQLHRSRPFGALIAPLAREGVFFFHHGRCGSTVLERLLNQHSRLRTFGEIFERPHRLGHLPAPPSNMLRACRTAAIPAHAIVEAKFFECQHLTLFGWSIPDFVECVKNAGYRRYIFLNRENYLRKVVSAEVARKRGRKWHFRSGETVPTTTVSLDINAVTIQGKTEPILDLFAYMDAQCEKLRKTLQDDDVLELTYEEDIVKDPQAAYRKVCEWLGLTATPAQVQLERSGTRALSDTVENWKDVVAALAGTRYEWMLEKDRAE
jgi:hypothetical protein